MRLDIPAGTAVRFEPGQTRDVRLVALAGDREVYGFRAGRDGQALSAKESTWPRHSPAPPMPTCSAPRPATGSGSPTPTLIIEIEKDFTIYGEEVKFGGGKVIRDGMGQSQTHARARRDGHGDHQAS